MSQPEPALVGLQWVHSLIVAYGLGMAMYFWLQRVKLHLPRVKGAFHVAGIEFCLAVMLCPLFIRADKVVARALVSVLCADLGFKLVDYSRQFRHLSESNSAGFREYCQFLIPFPIFLAVFQKWRRLRRRTSDRTGQIPRIVLGAVLFALCTALLKLTCHVRLLRDNFILEHVAHLMIFVVAIESLSQVGCGIEHLCGYDTSPLIRFGFVSRTVGEFWQRYNTRVHSWLIANVFSATTGTRSPVIGVWLTFLISGIQHELGFGIATSRFDGYQFAFFTLQAPGVLLSHAFDRQFARFGNTGKAASHVFTILWFAVTSPLFFHGVNRVFPFYCSTVR